MKNFFLLAALTAATILHTGHAQAQAVRAVKCDGCTLSQSASAAAAATDAGTVYVFNQSVPSVYKYRVTSEDLAGDDGGVIKRAVRVATESELLNSYVSFVSSLRASYTNPVITLPPDFPIQSVAGALLDPGWASTTLEDFLAAEGGVNQLLAQLNVLLTQLLKVKVTPWDMNALVGTIQLKFEFPDGSSLEYQASFSINAMSAESKLELDKPQNARLPDGSPVPTTSFGLRKFSVTVTSGSTEEWRAYVTGIGGSWGGTGTITCSIQDDVVLICKSRLR